MNRVRDVLDLFEQRWVHDGEVRPAMAGPVAAIYPVWRSAQPPESFFLVGVGEPCHHVREERVYVPLFPVEHSAATAQEAVDGLVAVLRGEAARLLEAALTAGREAASGDDQEVAGMLRTELCNLVAYEVGGKAVFVREDHSPCVLLVRENPTVYFLPEKDVEHPCLARATVGLACLGDGVVWVREEPPGVPA